MLTLLVVDDEYYVRRGIRETIEWEKYGIEIIGEAGDGEKGLELALLYKPDVILTDIIMPFMDGLEFMDKIRENGLKSGIIILSGHDEFEYAQRAMSNGASAYLLKPLEKDKLIETVMIVGNRVREERGSAHYFEKLKNELSSIKKVFILDLISGNITDEKAIKEKIEFYNIPLDTENNYVVVLKINRFSKLLNEFDSEKIKLIKDAIEQKISQYLLINKKFMGIMVEKNPGEWVVILHGNQVMADMKDLEDMVKERCFEFLNSLKIENNATVSVGISGLGKTIQDINVLYKQVCASVELKGITNISCVIDATEEIIGMRREVKVTIEYIKRNYSKDITIDMAAKELYISTYHLMHIFKDDVGKTFNEFLQDFRVEIAKQLLRDPRYKVYEVCDMVGYKDPKYFTRIFKKVTGMSPSEYLK